MSRRPNAEIYPVERSPLYRMGRLRDLAAIIGMDLKLIRRLAHNRNDHYWRKERLIGEKKRLIVCPFGIMRQIHERVQSLCNRVEQPEYLHSPRRGHTAAGNADIHRSSKVVAKLDIRQFYPSTTDEHVFRFFRNRMNMTDDVAGLITKLCTVDRRLPFGSPLSPILCTLVHRELFDQIALYCRSLSLKMSLWVDDITMSGDTVTESAIWTVKQIIHASGLEYHKVKVRALSQGVIITGHYLHHAGVAAANKHHLGVRDSLADLDRTADPAARLKLVRSLIGKTNYGRSIYDPTSPVRERLDRRRDWLHAERRRLEALPIDVHAAQPLTAADLADTSVPWDTADDDVHSRFLAALAVLTPPLPDQSSPARGLTCSEVERDPEL
jgi:RNA-directed DNA polymerase